MMIGLLCTGLGLWCVPDSAASADGIDLSHRAYQWFECNWNGRRCTTCVPKAIGHSMYCTEVKILCDCDKVNEPPDDCTRFTTFCGELMSCTDPACQFCSPAGQPCWLPTCIGTGSPCPP